MYYVLNVNVYILLSFKTVIFLNHTILSNCAFLQGWVQLSVILRKGEGRPTTSRVWGQRQNDREGPRNLFFLQDSRSRLKLCVLGAVVLFEASDI